MKEVIYKGVRLKALELHETKEFHIGRKFEAWFCRKLQEHGNSVVPLCDIQRDGRIDKAPMVEGLFKGYRTPDFLVISHGSTYWCEVKEKYRPSYTHSVGIHEHGIGLRCYRDYLEVERISGNPVYLVIGEYASSLVRVQSLQKLTEPPPRIYDGDKMDAGGMVFWPLNRFAIWGDGYLPAQSRFSY